MLFQNDEASLKLEIVSYEFPDGGMPGSNDCNWLMMRGTYREGERVIVDSNSCIMTQELQLMSAGLKVLGAGIKDAYESELTEPYFSLAVQAEDGAFKADVSFALPNTMEDLDTAELECTLTSEELKALIADLDQAAEKFPERK